MNDLKRVAIVGGVHGNELLGVYLVKKFQQYPHLVKRNGFEVITLLANPQAAKLNRRYIDLDLNRCFALEDLNNNKLIYHEQNLAKKIVRQLQAQRIDFLIDIHTSTANMGITLLLSNLLPFNLKLIAYLLSLDPTIKVVYFQNNREENRLRNICNLGFTLEIGSIPHGTLDSIWFQKTEKLINNILNYLDLLNNDFTSDRSISLTQTIPLYKVTVPINFPVDEAGQLTAMIHPTLLGKDYCELAPKQPIFLKFDDSNIVYQGSQIVYPIFINESAYQEYSIAMYLTTKQIINCP
ncbi:MAG: aspartoacylase [Pleurocapsa sp.]